MYETVSSKAQEIVFRSYFQNFKSLGDSLGTSEIFNVIWIFQNQVDCAWFDARFLKSVPIFSPGTQSPKLVHSVSVPCKIMKFNRIVLKNFYFYLFFRSNAGKCLHCNHCNILELWGWLNSSHRCLSTRSLLNTARTNMEVVSRFSDREKTQTHPLKYFLKTIFDLLGASWTRLVNQEKKPFSLFFSWMNCFFSTLF